MLKPASCILTFVFLKKIFGLFPNISKALYTFGESVFLAWPVHFVHKS